MIKLDINRIRESIIIHEGNKEIFAFMGWLTLDKVIRLGVGLFIGVWVARHLGPEQFGILNYAVAWVGLFGVFSTLGMDGIVIRDIVRRPENRGAILGTSFLIRIVGSIALVFTSIGMTLLVDSGQPVRQTIVVILAAAQVFRPLDIIDLWFQAMIKWRNIFIARNGAFVISSFLRILLVFSGVDVFWFALLYIIDALLTAVFLLIAGLTVRDRKYKWKFDLETARCLLKDSWPLAISSIAIILYMRIDQVMIGRMLDNSQVGIYSAAARISEVWYFIPMVIAQSVFPSLVEVKRTNELLYWKRMKLMCSTLIWLGVSVAVVFQFASGWIIALLYGEKYAAAAAILRVHSWAGVFVALGVVSSNWYILENKQRFGLIVTCVGAVTNICLNLFLIPAFGTVGAAMANIFSQMTSVFLVPGVIPEVRQLFRIMLRAFIPIPELSYFYRKK